MAILGVAEIIFGVEDNDEVMLGANLVAKRAWDWKFGSLLWAHKTPSFFDTINENWDMTFDPQGKSLEAFRRKPTAVAAK